MNVLIPANVCVEVDTSPRDVLAAFGRLNVCTVPVDEILKSVPEVLATNV